MIFEYAIDPALILRWAEDRRNYTEFINAIGLGSPRVMAEFPKRRKWRRLILEAMPTDWQDTNKGRRVTELVAGYCEIVANRSGFEYEGNDSWDSNIERENQRDPFDHIFTRDGSNFACANSFCETDAHWGCDAWTKPGQETIFRTAEEFSRCAGNMLRLSKHALFVDPFLGTRVDVLNVLEACIRKAHENRHLSDPFSVELIYDLSVDHSPIPVSLLNAIKARITGLLPLTKLTIKGVTHRVEGERLHNRYLLTDLGGVMFGHSFGENANQKDVAVLLSRDTYEQLWAEYAEGEIFGSIVEASL